MAKYRRHDPRNKKQNRHKHQSLEKDSFKPKTKHRIQARDVQILDEDDDQYYFNQ